MIDIDSDLLIVTETRKFLGFIPTQKYEKRILLKDVRSTTISCSYKRKRVFSSLLLFLVSLASIVNDQFVLGNTLEILALTIFSISIRTELVIQYLECDCQVSVPFFKEEELLEVHQKILRSLTKDTRKQNKGVVVHEKVESILK